MTSMTSILSQKLWAPQRCSSGLGPAHPTLTPAVILHLPPSPLPAAVCLAPAFLPQLTPASTSLGKLKAPSLGHSFGSFSPPPLTHTEVVGEFYGVVWWFGVPGVINLESINLDSGNKSLYKLG